MDVPAEVAAGDVLAEEVVVPAPEAGFLLRAEAHVRPRGHLVLRAVHLVRLAARLPRLAVEVVPAALDPGPRW